MDTIKFYNGVEAPTLSYGTWLIKNSDAANCVKLALKSMATDILIPLKHTATKSELDKALEN